MHLPHLKFHDDVLYNLIFYLFTYLLIQSPAYLINESVTIFTQHHNDVWQCCEKYYDLFHSSRNILNKLKRKIEMIFAVLEMWFGT